MIASGYRTGALALSLALSSPTASPSGAQQQPDSIPGVELGLLYSGVHRPVLAVAPFPGVAGAESVATQAEAIVRRDLDYSDRFDLMASSPPALLSAERMDYVLWDRYSVDYVVRGRVEGADGAFTLELEIHDVVYGRLLAVRSVPLPSPQAPGFRMAVHRASDAVVAAIFDEPGMAASRIAFSMRAAGSATKDLYVVDADGENLRRVSRHDLVILSPAWHPGGERIAFSSLLLEGSAPIFEVDLRSGEERRLPVFGEGQPGTPTYLPGGNALAVTLDLGMRSRIVSYDVARGCCPSVLIDSRWQDLSPAFSPDGRWMAFTSNRLGVGSPLVYVRAVEGGDVELIAPFVVGASADFTSPEWSPLGGLVAYHGKVGRGSYQILVTEFEGRAGATRQVTAEGNNESPSWAPDGRHLVFVGQRPEGSGVFVLDTATGRLRLLVSGREVSTPAWSPLLPAR